MKSLPIIIIMVRTVPFCHSSYNIASLSVFFVTRMCNVLPQRYLTFKDFLHKNTAVHHSAVRYNARPSAIDLCKLCVCKRDVDLIRKRGAIGNGIVSVTIVEAGVLVVGYVPQKRSLNSMSRSAGSESSAPCSKSRTSI